MSELTKIILTAALTLFGGIVVFVAGQVVLKFFIEPIREQSKVISEINDSLIYFASFYMNPEPVRHMSFSSDRERDEASNTLRRHASQLDSKTKVIIWYRMWERLRVVPKRSGVTEACRGLIGLSNNLFSADRDGARVYKTQIMEGLNLPSL